ncbi:hypothetical protein F2P81_013094 [Scophthalmus maximus]|uniref:Uncharacterized protein n=1 Tax=Scophthalmus maximus TaxID=52904 RepID=A0A6A4SJG9_SCOMX|nr:hypothetical protein F2P81_013094 [Scophthalmus maximus]
MKPQRIDRSDERGTITSSPLLDVSITDRSVALPTAVPDVPLFCEHFMARHILCFHITDKFVMSLSPRPLLDSLNDVAQLQELTLVQRNLGGKRKLNRESASCQKCAATPEQKRNCDLELTRLHLAYLLVLINATVDCAAVHPPSPPQRACESLRTAYTRHQDTAPEDDT